MRRGILAVVALCAATLVFPVRQASALSAQCSMLNNSGSQTGPQNNSGSNSLILEAGETITVTLTSSGGGVTFAATPLWNFTFSAAGTQTQTYTAPVTGAIPYNLNIVIPAGVTLTFSVTCVATSNSSSLLDQVRQQFAKIAAQTSSANISDSVIGAIGDAFEGGSTQVSNGRISTSFAAIDRAQEKPAIGDKARQAYAALGGDMVTKAPPRGPLSPWHAWIDVRYTALDDRTDSTFAGRHTNATGGLSYRFNDRFVGGVVVGFEDFTYRVGSSDVGLDGSGWTAGGYFGWKFLGALRLDGMLAYSRISYGAQAAAVTGDFDADRVTGMLRLAGRWNQGGWYFEPSARVIYAHENQDAFTDTAAVAHSAYSFNVGLASFGGEVGVPLIVSGGIVTPWAGLFGDYRLGDTSATAVAALPNLDDGLSARVTGGLRWSAANGFSTSIGGEYGGLGSDVRYWRARGSLGLKF